MGEGSPDPRPTACVVVDGDVVGWVDFDRDEREWLPHDEVNIGYSLHPDARGRGYATRAVKLLISHIARETDVKVATLLIDPDNQWSLGVADRAGFGPMIDLNGQCFFKRPIPALTYSDGTVTIRRQRIDDAEMNIDTLDDEQIDWLWLRGHRELWEAMTPDEQIAHKRGNMRTSMDAFARGPKWTFAIEADGAYAGMVDCDLANEHVPAGEANISYSSHPAHRGNGYVSAAVRLILQFITDHTGARDAHIIVDAENVASLRVALAVGAVEADRHVNDEGRTMIRHVLALRQHPVLA